jgi:SSS family solute:Na+ symporter
MMLTDPGLGVVDYAFILIALIAALYIGIKSAGKIKNLRDYAVSNEVGFPIPMLAITMIVTGIGSGASMGVIAETYNNGIIYPITEILCIAGPLLVIKYAARFIAGRYSGKISLYGIIETEYGLAPARFAAVISALLSLVSLSMQIVGMGYLAKTFLGVEFALGALLSTVVFVSYSSLGGIRGVIYTDVLQFVLILCIFPILVGVIFFNTGGVASIINSLPAEKLKVFNHPDFIEHAYLTAFWIMPFSFLHPSFIQRFLICKNSRELRQMGLIWVGFGLVFTVMVGVIGLASIGLFNSDIAGKEVVPTIMKNYFPVGLKGLAIAAFFAILMSTADSELNAATVLVAEVFIANKEPSSISNEGYQDNSQARWLRVVSAVLGGAALALALMDFSMIKSITMASALAFAAVNIPIFLAPFKVAETVSSHAYKGSVLGGFISFLLLWVMLGEERVFMASFYAMLAAIAGWFIGARCFGCLQFSSRAKLGTKITAKIGSGNRG